MRVEYHEQAECDLQEAIAYYRHREPQVARKLHAMYDECIEAIRCFPNVPPRREHGLRRRRVGQFPYAIVYAAFPDYIYVLTIENLLRRPGYWHQRLKDLPEP